MDQRKSVQAEVHGLVGNSAKIPCDFPHRTKLKFITWHKNGDSIYTFDTRKVDLVNAKHYPMTMRDITFMALEKPSYLSIQKLLPEDEGVYTCHAFYRGERPQSFSTYLVVIVLPEPIKIFDSNQKEIMDGILGPILEGNEAEITCQVLGGRPRPLVTWWREGDLLDKEIDFEENGALQNTLSLPPLTRESQGKTITCQATNSNLTSLQSEITLDIHYSPLTVEITTPESALVADAEYQIECRSDGGRPPAIITWFLDEKQLSNTEYYTTNSDNTTLSTVKFTPKSDDGGKTLECRSQSPTIDHLPLTDHWTLDIHYTPRVNLTMTPTEGIKEGDNVTLVCQANGNPKPTNINWFHKKLEIDPSLISRIESVGNSLILSSVTRNMSGIYSCVASNSAGNGNSQGVVLHIQYAPVCSIEGVQLVGASMREEISVYCNVKASPNVISYRWQFNQRNETIDMAETTFTTGDKQSVLTYAPMIADDFGNFTCWATNELGEQIEPCTFQLVEASYPQMPENCTFLKNFTSSSVFVECGKGHDGGLPQIFIAEVTDLERQSLTQNVSTWEPYFIIDDLPPGTDFLLTIYSANARGPSEKQKLQVYTAGPEEGTISINTQIFPITPILGVLIGVVGALVIAAVVIGFIMCLRSNSREKESLDSGTKRSRSPQPSKDGGDSGNGRTEGNADGEGFPIKLKHANIYETVAYESSEDGKRAEIVSEKAPEENLNKDNVEYAELNFSSCKKQKSKKPKSEKKSSKSNGKIRGSYDPTLYASIDHVQTEKQKLVAKEKELQHQGQPLLQSQPRQTSPMTQSLSPRQQQLQKNGLPSPSKCKPIAPTVPSQLLTKQDSKNTLPPSPPPPISPDGNARIPATSKEVRRSLTEAGASSPYDETGSKKATGKPTNLDKPSIPKKPVFAPEVVKRKKKTAETQTSPLGVEDGDNNEDSSRTKKKKRDSYPSLSVPDDSKEDIPLMDVTIESSL